MRNYPSQLENGYQNHYYGEDNAVGILSSCTYSYSAAKLEKFHSTLSKLYATNANMKMLLDFLSVWTAGSSDLVIMYGANVGPGIYGYYSSYATLGNLDCKVLNFNAFLGNDDDLLDTIAHEGAHLLADLLFCNLSNGYKEDDLVAADTFHTALKEIYINTYKIMKGADAEQIFSTLNVHELLYLNQCVYEKYRITHTENTDLKIFLNEFVLPGAYPDFQVDAECFARMFQLQARFAESDIVQKLLSPMKKYVDDVLNPALSRFGLSYDMKVQEFSDGEKLFFALFDGNANEQYTHVDELVVFDGVLLSELPMWNEPNLQS